MYIAWFCCTWKELVRVKYFIWKYVNAKWQGTPGEYWIINNSISSLLAPHIYAYWISCWVSKESVCLCERKQDTTEPASVRLQRISCCAIQTIKSPQSLGELPGTQQRLEEKIELGLFLLFSEKHFEWDFKGLIFNDCLLILLLYFM